MTLSRQERKALRRGNPYDQTEPIDEARQVRRYAAAKAKVAK